MTMFSTKYPNNIRTVTGIPILRNDDVVLECDTTLAPVIINLLDIPADQWNTLWKLYIVDKSNNASTNNIIVNAPLGAKINGASSFSVTSNGASFVIRMASNSNYVGQYSVITVAGISGHVIEDEGIALPQKPIIDFQGAGVTATDVAGKTIVTIPGSSGGHIIEDEGIVLPQQPVLDFQGAGVTAIDSAGKTIVTIPGGSGITNFTVTDTGTIDLTLTAIIGGFNLSGDVKMNDYFTALKNMQVTNTSYCKRTDQLGALQKYDNPFQSNNDGAFFDNYSSKTENGNCVGAFDVTSGLFTIPTTGWYYIQSSIGYALNSNPYNFQSSNANTLNQFWTAAATDIASFSLTNFLVGSGLLSVNIKTLTRLTSQLYLGSNVLVRLNAGAQVKVVFTNNSDLEMFGQPNSSMVFRAVKLGN